MELGGRHLEAVDFCHRRPDALFIGALVRPALDIQAGSGARVGNNWTITSCVSSGLPRQFCVMNGVFDYLSRALTDPGHDSCSSTPANHARCRCGSHSSIDSGIRKSVSRSIERKLLMRRMSWLDTDQPMPRFYQMLPLHVKFDTTLRMISWSRVSRLSTAFYWPLPAANFLK